MKSSYWERRLKEEADNRTKSEVLIQKEMHNLYKQVNNNVEREINAFLGRYAHGKDFSIKDLRRAIDKEDVRAYYDRARAYVKDKDFSKRANAHMKAYNLTMRTNRLEYLRAMIDLEIISGFSAEEGITNSLLNKYALEKFKEQSGILGLTIPTEKLMHAKIETLKNTPFKGKLWSDRLWDRQALLGHQVKKMAQELVLLGKNPTTHVNRIKELFDVNSYEARRLAVTEGAIIQTRVTQYNYTQNGIEEYKFVAESGACPMCSGLHGNKYRVDDMMSGDNASPMHPHCHCTEVPFVDREAWENEQDLLDSEVDKTAEIGYNIGEPASNIAIGTQFGKLGKYTEHPRTKVDWGKATKYSNRRMEERGIDQDFVDLIVENGIALEQADGLKHAFITKEGVAIVQTDGKLVTTYKKDTFDDKLNELIKIIYGE